MREHTKQERARTCLTSSVVKGRGAMMEWETVNQLASRSSSGTVTVVI